MIAVRRLEQARVPSADQYFLPSPDKCLQFFFYGHLLSRPVIVFGYFLFFLLQAKPQRAPRKPSARAVVHSDDSDSDSDSDSDAQVTGAV